MAYASNHKFSINCSKPESHNKQNFKFKILDKNPNFIAISTQIAEFFYLNLHRLSNPKIELDVFEKFSRNRTETGYNI